MAAETEVTQDRNTVSGDVSPLESIAPPRRRSVLFVLPTLHGGGAERVVLTILRHLDRHLFEVSLAVVDARKPVFAADLPQGIEVIDLGCTRVRYSGAALIRLIWERRPDIVFCALGHLNLQLALIKPLLPRSTKLIARETIVMSSYLIGNRFSRAWKFAYRFLLPRCDAIICQSQDMKDGLVSAIGLSSKNMMVVQNPVDIKRVRELSNEPLEPDFRHDSSVDTSTICLVAAGRLVWQKGFDLLIEAIALLGNSCFHATIVGQGQLRGELEKLAMQLGVGPQIHFLGFRSNPYPLFKSADAFVLSSRFEGMPNVVLEALACGTGVIATPAPGGIHELLQGRPCCAIAKSVSARSLAEALERYDFRNRANHLEFELDDYTVETVCSRYANIFSTIGAEPP